MKSQTTVVATTYMSIGDSDVPSQVFQPLVVQTHGLSGKMRLGVSPARGLGHELAPESSTAFLDWRTVPCVGLSTKS